MSDLRRLEGEFDTFSAFHLFVVVGAEYLSVWSDMRAVVAVAIAQDEKRLVLGRQVGHIVLRLAASNARLYLSGGSFFRPARRGWEAAVR